MWLTKYWEDYCGKWNILITFVLRNKIWCCIFWILNEIYDDWAKEETLLLFLFKEETSPFPSNLVKFSGHVRINTCQKNKQTKKHFYCKSFFLDLIWHNLIQAFQAHQMYYTVQGLITMYTHHFFFCYLFIPKMTSIFSFVLHIGIWCMGILIL